MSFGKLHSLLPCSCPEHMVQLKHTSNSVQQKIPEQGLGGRSFGKDSFNMNKGVRDIT